MWHIIKLIGCGLAFLVIVTVMTGFVFKAMGQETEWRAQRMCDQGYSCAGKMGV